MMGNTQQGSAPPSTHPPSSHPPLPSLNERKQSSPPTPSKRWMLFSLTSKGSSPRRKQQKQQKQQRKYQPPVRTLLWNTNNLDEHYALIREVVKRVKSLSGEEGLRSIGFEYRPVPCCDKHCCTGQDDTTTTTTTTTPGGVDIGFVCTEIPKSKENINFCYPPSSSSLQKSLQSNEYMSDEDGIDSLPDYTSTEASISLPPTPLPSCENLQQANYCHQEHNSSISDMEHPSSVTEEADCENHPNRISPPPEEEDDTSRLSCQNDSCCPNCTTRLFHIPSNTMITLQNRAAYIADGTMFDEVSRLCQEYAQKVMATEGSLHWLTICDDPTLGAPIRALVHSNFLSSSSSSQTTGSTLLITTGKGKVRAGIFSRQHLMTTGLEHSTALPYIREANRRNMEVVLLDPNARTDRQGMLTFERSLRHVFGSHSNNTNKSLSSSSSSSPIYVLAHSASGAQLIRCLRNDHDCRPYLLPRIRALAFTDSTHNIQWARDDDILRTLLECPYRSLYVRSSNVRNNNNNNKNNTLLYAGKPVGTTDTFWKHRFGNIKTIWAGTDDHSLMNWSARIPIWDHFDTLLLE